MRNTRILELCVLRVYDVTHLRVQVEGECARRQRGRGAHEAARDALHFAHHSPRVHVVALPLLEHLLRERRVHALHIHIRASTVHCTVHTRVQVNRRAAAAAAEANRLERGVVLPELLEAHQRGHEPRVVRAAHCDDALVLGERAGRVTEVGPPDRN